MKTISSDYIVCAGGKPVEVVRVPKPQPSAGGIADENEWHSYSYAVFEAAEAIAVSVKSDVFDLSRTIILPESKNVKPEYADAGEVRFKMPPRTTLVLEPHGRHDALVISSNIPDENPPRQDDPKVKFYGPGYHQAGFISLGDDETLYLAHGAWVEGFVKGEGKNIRICGGGVLSGEPWRWHEGPEGSVSMNMSGNMVLLSGSNIDVRDVTLFSSWAWTLVFNNVDGAVVDNVKILCGRVINDDGIDICRAKNVTIRDSFIRCQDDCIAAKWWCENLVCAGLTLWCDSANPFRIGYECEPGESGLVYRNLQFSDIDILHLSINKRPITHYWAHAVIHIQPSHGQTMSDLRFENIRLHECGPEDYFLKAITMPITQGSPLCRTEEAGYLDGLAIKNVHIPDSGGGMGILISSHDADHYIKNIRLENVTGYGKVEIDGVITQKIEAW